MNLNLLNDPAFVMEATSAVREALVSAVNDGSLFESDMFKYTPCYQGDAFEVSEPQLLNAA